MARMMTMEYNSDFRQLQVKNTLNAMLGKNMSAHEISNTLEVLTQIIDLMKRLSHHCQPQFRSDANEINYLRKAIIFLSMAMTPIVNIITAKYSLSGFQMALREHLQLQNEVKMVPASSIRSRFTKKDVHYQQYGKNLKLLQKYGRAVNPPLKSRPPALGSFAESRRKRICHRCKQTWRPEHHCAPGSIRRYVLDRFKDGDAAVDIV